MKQFLLDKDTLFVRSLEPDAGKGTSVSSVIVWHEVLGDKHFPNFYYAVNVMLELKRGTLFILFPDRMITFKQFVIEHGAIEEYRREPI